MPADETERERGGGEREGGRGSKWFATLQGLAVKTTSQSQTMSITGMMSTGSQWRFLLSPLQI